MTPKLYKVGGCVRDELLGIKAKDIDYAVEAESFEAMEAYVLEKGKIYLSTPKYQTIRGMIHGEAVDFVWCRKEGPYSDGRRPDWVKAGTLMDDLSRRDFTMNAIAKDENDVFIDPFEGRKHIEIKLIKCVGKAEDRLREDSLRLIRAVRFAITKQFNISEAIELCLRNYEIISLLDNVSVERIWEELLKCFEYNTTISLMYLMQMYPRLGAKIFENNRLWLKPSLREAEKS